LNKRSNKVASPTLGGSVVASFGRSFMVELADSSLITCTTRGKRTDIACGDRVQIAMTAPEQGVIEVIEPRASLFYRSDIQRQKLIAANVTRIVVVLAVPTLHRHLLDRCLAAAEYAEIPVLLALNKMDLPQSDVALAALDLYRALGYEVLPVADKIDIAPLRAALAGHTSVLVGQSGMGKSTIINRLLPDAAARVGELSEALGSGRHTTTHARLYHLDANSSIIDSPGLQEFGLQHVETTELANCYVEMRPQLGRCKFNDCRHMSEPGCAIIALMESGGIDAARVASYRELLLQIENKSRYRD
jgi:ribosome biogenesis GTPase